MPTSLAYHLADIYLEELDKALGNSPVPSPLPAPLSTLLNPFIVLAARTINSTSYQRIQSALLDPLYTSLSTTHESDEPPSRKRPRLSVPSLSNLVSNACAERPKEEGALSSSALKKTILKRMFDIASEPDSRDANRRKLYTLWKEHMEDDEDVSDAHGVDGS